MFTIYTTRKAKKITATRAVTAGGLKEGQATLQFVAPLLQKIL